MSADWNPKIHKEWPEHLALLVLIIGFVISVQAVNPYLNYLIIFLFGIMAGRTIYLRRGKSYFFPTFLIIIGFFLGYSIGSLFWANWYIVLIMFILGAYLSHEIHKRGYMG